MEKEQGKVISIRLVDILAIILIICAITVTVKNVKTKENIQQIEDVAKSQQVEENNLRINQRVSSRAEETSRQILGPNEENTTENVVNSQNDVNSEIKSEENINNHTDDMNKSGNEQSEDSVVEEVEENNYISLEELTISEKMDLTERTGLSKDDFVELISRVKQDSSKFFYENAELIYDLCEKYEINEIFFCGLISAESGWNIASNHRRTYNYISLMVNGTLKQFASVEDGLEQAAKVLHEKYLTPGGRFYNGKTLAGVKTRFCPSSSTWTGLVYGRMKQIYNNK